MPSKFNNKQKSLERRFLLVLGVFVFLAVFALGLLIIFDKLNVQLSPTERYVFGGLIIAYSFLRVSRILKKQPDENEEA
jgi:cytochrome c biogenesis protein CcdA